MAKFANVSILRQTGRVNNAIDTARKIRGVTGRELARRAGISYATTARILAGTSTPRVPDLQRLARALQVPTDVLLASQQDVAPAMAVADLTALCDDWNTQNSDDDARMKDIEARMKAVLEALCAPPR